MGGEGVPFLTLFLVEGVTSALLTVHFCLRGRIFDAISGEGVRFSAPLKTTLTDAFSDEGVAFLVAFPTKGLHF